MTKKRVPIDRENRDLLPDGRAKVVHGSHLQRKNAIHVKHKSPPHAPSQAEVR